MKLTINKIRVCVCEHTNKLVVQERFSDGWICMHGDNEQEDLELIKQYKQYE